MKQLFLLLIVSLLSHVACTQDCVSSFEQIKLLHAEAKYAELIKVGTEYEKTCCQTPDSLCIETFGILSNAFVNQEKFRAAISYTMKGVAVVRKLGREQDPYLGTSFSNIGYHYFALGDMVTAIEYHSKSLENAILNKDSLMIDIREVGLNVALEGLGLKNTGRTMMNEEEYRFLLMKDSLVYPDMPDKVFKALSILGEAWLKSKAKDAESGLILLDKSIQLFKGIDMAILKPLTQKYIQLQGLATKLLLCELLLIGEKYQSVIDTVDSLFASNDRYLPLLTIALLQAKIKAHYELNQKELALENLRKLKLLFPKNQERVDLVVKGANGMALKIFLELGKMDSVKYYKKEIEQYMLKEIDKSLDVLSTWQKENLLQDSKKHYYDLGWQLVQDHINEDWISLEQTYQQELTKKRIIFDTDQNILKVLALKVNSEIQHTYDKLHKAKKQLAWEHQTKSIVNIDSFSRLINLYEQQLSLVTAPYRIKRQSISPTEILNILKAKGETLIEFINFEEINKQPNQGYLRTFYGAVILNGQTGEMNYVPLFEEGELIKVLEEDLPRYSSSKVTHKRYNKLYNSNKLYQLIWEPLEPYIEDVSKVNYVPTGLLHQIAFAGIKKDKNHLIERFNSFKLINSGRDIVLDRRRENISIQSVIGFGGIDYNRVCESSSLFYVLDMLEKVGFIKSERLNRSIGNRDSLQSLQGSLHEIIALQKMTNALSKDQTQYYTDCAASEERFKSIGVSINPPDLLVVTTHGDVDQSRLNEVKEKYAYADNPLQHSRFFLAGSNDAWHKQKKITNRADGIVTAFDIAEMNLKDTKLAVLSSCSSGLGGISSGEGIYGLRRSFQMAGVDWVLMSLWDIDDKASSEYMAYFYKQLFQKNNIRLAYQYAQNQMRLKYPQQPFYWAAFVLI